MTELVPTTPSATELDVLMRQADLIAHSSIVPRDYQRQPGNVLAAGLMGRAFGWDVMTAMRCVTVIQGVATLKPEAQLALIRQRGHSVSITPHEDGRGVTVTGKRCDTGDTGSASFTLDDAERAGLLRNNTWKAYPLDMCTWRAVSRLGRQLFGDVVLGAGYAPEEIALARATDVTTVEVLPTGEIAGNDLADNDWRADAMLLDNVEGLRLLYATASAAGADADTLTFIADRGKALAAAVSASDDAVVDAEIVEDATDVEADPFDDFDPQTAAA